MKAEELRSMTDEQLVEARRGAIKELFQLRFRAATEKQEAPAGIREMRRRIARIKTIERERELKLQPKQQAGA